MCKLPFEITEETEQTIVAIEGRYRDAIAQPAWTSFTLPLPNSGDILETPDILVNGEYHIEVRVQVSNGLWSNWKRMSSNFVVADQCDTQLVNGIYDLVVVVDNDCNKQVTFKSIHDTIYYQARFQSINGKLKVGSSALATDYLHIDSLTNTPVGLAPSGSITVPVDTTIHLTIQASVAETLNESEDASVLLTTFINDLGGTIIRHTKPANTLPCPT